MEIDLLPPIENLCISIKNSKLSSKQCLNKRKYGEFCGKHKDGKCKMRYDVYYESCKNKKQNIENLNQKNNDNKSEIKKKETLENIIENINRLSKRKIILYLKKYNISYKNKSKVYLRQTLEFLLTTISYYKNYIPQIITIQKNYRKKYINDIYGLNSFVRKNITNDVDPILLLDIKDIPFHQLFTFKDNNFTYGFHIYSISTLINNKQPNPYNRNIFSNKTIQNVKKRLRYMDKHNISIKNGETIYHLTPIQEITSRVVTLFQKIDELDNYTDVDWFLNLCVIQLKKFYLWGYEIWNYCYHAPIHERKRIRPPNGNAFHKKHLLSKYNEKNKISLQNFILDELEKFIMNNISSKEEKKIGAWLILTALTRASNLAAIALPHLYNSVPNINI